MIPSAMSGVIDAVLDRDDDKVDETDTGNRNAAATSRPEASSAGAAPGSADIGETTSGSGDAAANHDRGAAADGTANGKREFHAADDAGAGFTAVGGPGGPGDTAWPSDNTDPSALSRLYWFDRDIDRKIQRYRRDGKDPHDLFDPSKADYLGTPAALAPHTGRGLLWLASNGGGDPPGRIPTTPPVDAATGKDTAAVPPSDAAPEATNLETSEPAAAEDARVKAAERLARSMRAGGNPDSNLLPLTLLLALPFVPEIAPAILGADATGAPLGARTIAALRTAWPKIKDAVAQLPGFARSGSNQSGLSFDEFLKEIQTKLNIPPMSREPPTTLQDADLGEKSTQFKETERANDTPPPPQDDKRPDQIKDLPTRAPGSEAAEPVSKDYRKTFVLANPELDGKVWVHHAIPQVVLKKYPGVMTEAEIHALDNLRGIPNGMNRDLHLKELAAEWNKFYRKNRTATTELLQKKAMELDIRYGHLFLPALWGDR